MPSSIITNNNNSSSSSSSIRFMGLLKQPDSDPANNLNLLEEFDENDVLWSESSDSTNSFSPTTSSPTRLHPPPPPQQQRAVATLYKSNSGLSAALSDDHHPLVRRKSTLNRSAAKMIPPTAAVIFRSENSGYPFPKCHQSAPVNVPVWRKKNNGPFDRFDDDGEHEQQQLDGDSDEVMIPPHVMVAQSHVTFSVFEGVGRTLKGRDLRRVRNAVFQQTGFID